MSDLVERLRNAGASNAPELIEEAASELERLRGIVTSQSNALCALAAAPAEPAPAAWRQQTSTLNGAPRYHYNEGGHGEPLYTHPVAAPAPEPVANPAMAKARKAAEARLSYFREMTEGDTMTLPPLPEPVGVVFRGTQLVRAFDADQMEAYGLACRAAALEEAAKVCEKHLDWGGGEGV